MSAVSTWILVGIVVVFIALVLSIIAKQYRKVGPNEALIISGGRKRTIPGPDGTKNKVGYRCPAGRRDVRHAVHRRRSTSCPWTSSR